MDEYKIINILKYDMYSSLYSNAFYIILNSAASSFLGFVFWNLMVREFPPAVVGIGSALFAATGLISVLANLGLGNGLVRFVPEVGGRGRRLVNSAFAVSGGVAVCVAVFYMAGVGIWSPGLEFLNKNYFMWLGFVIVTGAVAISNLCDNSFIAQRSAKYTFWKNLIVNLTKMPLPALIFFGLGGYGIYLSQGVAIIIAVIVAFVFLLPRAYPRDIFGRGTDFMLLRQILSFSLSNYLATLFTNAIGFIFPLMVLNMQGAENNAYFYMAWIMANFVTVIPNGVATSLFAECSHHPQSLSRHIKKALWLTFILLIPAIGGMYLLSPWLLRFFGRGYVAHGTDVMRWLILANFPIAINAFYTAVNDVKKRRSYIVIQTFIMSSLTLCLGYLLLEKMGLVGIGVAYTLAALVVALVVALPLWRAMHEAPGGVVPGGIGSRSVAGDTTAASKA